LRQIYKKDRSMVRFGCLKGLSWAGLIILFVVQQTRNVNVASGITSFSN
jgi:hypothetical protein